jgi:hypothetical protein
MVQSNWSCAHSYISHYPNHADVLYRVIAQGRHSDIGEATSAPVIIPLFNTIIDLIGIIHAVWIQLLETWTMTSKIILCGKYMRGVVNGVFTRRHNRNNPNYFTPALLKDVLDDWQDRRKMLALVPFPRLRKHSK